MATQNYGLALPQYDSGNWNGPLNGNFTILDAVLGGVLSLPLTGPDYTLYGTDTQNRVINLTGNIDTATTNIIWPINVGGSWIVANNCTGQKSLKLRTANNTQNPLTLAFGSCALIYSDGQNLYFAENNAANIFLPIAGGTLTGPVQFGGGVNVAGTGSIAFIPAGSVSGMILNSNNTLGLFALNNTQIGAYLNLQTGTFHATGGVVLPVDGVDVNVGDLIRAMRSEIDWLRSAIKRLLPPN